MNKTKIILAALLVLVATFAAYSQSAIDEYHFHSGKSVLKGKISNKPANDWGTVSVTFYNIFTDEEHVKNIPVNADGTFAAVLTLPHTQSIFINDIGTIFLAVGDTVEVTKDANQPQYEGYTLGGHGTSATINLQWPELRRHYFGDVEFLYTRGVTAEQIPAWKTQMVQHIDRIIADIKADKLPLPAGTSPYIKEVMGASLLAEPFRAIMEAFRNNLTSFKMNDYYDFIADREEWLLDNPAMTISVGRTDIMFSFMGMVLMGDIHFMSNGLNIGYTNKDNADVIAYKQYFLLPHLYDADFHRDILSLRQDTLLTIADYYRLAMEKIKSRFNLKKNDFMQQVALCRDIFNEEHLGAGDEEDGDDEDGDDDEEYDDEAYSPDNFAACFAGGIPYLNNPIVAYHAVDRYRKYVVRREGKVVDESVTPEADKIFQRIIAPYQGNALYVNFWGMSCAPCRVGMLEERDKVAKLKNLPVRVLYICDERDSPREPSEQWMNEKNIKGEHIYVTHEEWKYLSEKFQFDAIPFHTAVDIDGNIVKPSVIDRYVNDLKKKK